MSAPLQSATVDALQAVKRALDEELGQVRLDRELLRRLDARRMLERAAEREAFNARLHELLSQANACFGALCQAAGVPDATLEGLAVVAP
ncbi:MAG: hypothetical protein K1X89_23795, partial [Myxococcaceae bacterium]|nr:hypothetical protein [Myxococcaceae bacterium]